MKGASRGIPGIEAKPKIADTCSLGFGRCLAGLAVGTACSILFLALVPTVGAQEGLSIVLPEGAEVPPEVLAALQAGNAAGAVPQAGQEASPEDEQLKALLALKFGRTAPAILGAMADGADAGTVATNETERFSRMVLVGDWPAAGAFLSGLTNNHGMQVYRHLLRELSNASPDPSMAGMGRPGMPVMMRPQGMGAAMNAAPPLSIVDVTALAEIAPHAIEKQDAVLLGQLLGRLLRRGDALEPLLKKLDAGVRGIGGKDPAARLLAAELLVAAGRVVESGQFLPSDRMGDAGVDLASAELKARQLQAAGTVEGDPAVLTQAWEVNQGILSSTNAAASNRVAALKRLFELMPALARELGTNWIRQTFRESPQQGLMILSAVSENVQAGLMNHDIEARSKALDFQREVVELLLDSADPAQPHWESALNLLAQGWTTEADYARQRYQPQRNFGPQYDQFGNMMYFEPYQQHFQDPNQMPAISVEAAIRSAPRDRWLARLDPSLRVAVIALRARLHMKTDEPMPALELVESIASEQPREAAALAGEFLAAWATARNPQSNRNAQMYGQMYGMYGPVYYGPGSPYGMRGPGISLTRARQGRNLRELAEIVQRLRNLKLPGAMDDPLVSAFTSAHSPAEVFQVEDVESVFGAIDGIAPELLAGLAQTMRERLARQWRLPPVQQQAKTQRTDKDIEAEVLRGYELVLGLIDRGLNRQPDGWSLNLARAAAFFDLAEFQYGKKVDLAVYVEKREEAFKGFARAAALYASALDTLKESEQRQTVYEQWFSANLGASDLAYVTRQQEPSVGQLERIREAMLALPGPAADHHMSRFAKWLGQSAMTIKPELRPRFVRAGLKVTGSHPDSEDARRMAAYYDDLLGEIEFVTRLDGDAVVGHGNAFGVMVVLRHTASLEREAGGFGRYLRNPKSGMYAQYFYPQGQQPRNFPEEFEKQVREKLTDKFDIQTLTFLDEKVESRGCGKPGWRETPLAFLLLKARDGSVDQIPALRMDLDFADTQGGVVLPVESQVILIDARPERVDPRPASGVEVTQVLDDRESADGRITLEIKATGRGLLPGMASLLKTNFAGWKVDEIVDQGLAVTRIDTEGDEVAPVSERNWLVKISLPEDAAAASGFRFPENALPDAKSIYKRYSDADLVEVEPAVALAGVTVRPRPLWHWIVAGCAVVAAVAGLLYLVARKRPEATETAPVYTLPEPVTPFAILELLQRMRGDDSLKWSEAHRNELGTSIHRLERHYFARERNGDPEPDLTGIGRRWVELAANGG